MGAAIFFSWLISTFIVSLLGGNRKIGMMKSFFISLLLSPLIGAFFVATSPKVNQTNQPSEEVQKYILSGNAKYSSEDFDGALSDYEKVLSLGTSNPNTNFKISCIYSLKKDAKKSFHYLGRAVQDGFTNFGWILSADELIYLREQPEFQGFSQNGYNITQLEKSEDDVICKLERLASLKEKGFLTESEFEEQKRNILQMSS